MGRFCSSRFFALILLFAGCSAWAQMAPGPGVSPQDQVARQPMVTGTVVYMQKMALPPDAAIEIKMQDISAGAPKTIAETVFAAAGQQVPISFQLTYNPADINQAHSYQVLANINVNGKPMFVTNTPLRVITGGSPSQISLLLQPAPMQTAASAGAKLRGTHWVLAEVNGQPARPGQGETPHFELHKKGNFSGSTGCNRLNGTYIASEGALQFTPGAMTMKACADPVMQQEQAMLAALKGTNAYQIEGNTLELKNGSQVLAKFAAEGK
jgi:putative lipoprotein